MKNKKMKIMMNSKINNYNNNKIKKNLYKVNSKIINNKKK